MTTSAKQAPTPTVAAIGELHLEGNITPHTFYGRREFKSDKGVTQHLAILIYSDDLYWYRPTQHRDELTGQVTHITRKFNGDMLQRTYAYYAEMLGMTKEQATAAVKFLVDKGLIRREFRTIKLPDGRRANNVMFVEPVVPALRALLQIEVPGGGGWFWVAEPPQPNTKKDAGTPIRNKPDSYGEQTGYLSQANGRAIRSSRDTNTETSQETSSETSTQSRSYTNVTGEGGQKAPERDDERPDQPQNNPNPETLEGAPQTNIPFPVTVDESEGRNMGEDAKDLEQVPPAAPGSGEPRGSVEDDAPLGWDAQVVNTRIDQLCNGRWLKGYEARGKTGTQPALIREVDSTGVDRTAIASTISPEALEELVREVRAERARLEAEAKHDTSIRVFSAQHMLIQAMQSRVLRIAHIRQMVADAARLDDPSEGQDAPAHAGLTAQNLTLGRQDAAVVWHKGDVVSYCRERYTVHEVDGRGILLDSDEAGSVRLNYNSDNIRAVRLISSAAS